MYTASKPNEVSREHTIPLCLTFIGQSQSRGRMLTEFEETCGCFGLQLNLQKATFMRNGCISDAPFMLNGTNISECGRCEYLSQEVSMKNDLIPEPGRRRRAAWGAYKSIGDVVKKTKNTRLRAHLFNTTVLSALTFALETWASRKQQENVVSVIERAIERVMLGVSHFTHMKDGILSYVSGRRLETPPRLPRKVK